MSAIDEVLKQNLPSGYTYEWVDQSRDERDAGSSSYMIFAVSLIFVYLCLSALYESWSLPLGIIFGVPTAVMGCVGFQYLRGLSADIYMQIGMIVLIGLSAKNSILIVEYAKMRVDNGRAILPALIDTVKVRLRPILMTAFSTVIGAVPLRGPPALDPGPVSPLVRPSSGDDEFHAPFYLPRTGPLPCH